MAKILSLLFCAVLIAFATQAHAEKRLTIPSVSSILGGVIGAFKGINKEEKVDLGNGQMVTMRIKIDKCLKFGKRFLGSVGNFFKDIGNKVKDTFVPTYKCKAEICIVEFNLCGRGEASSQTSAAEKAQKDLQAKASG